MMPNDENFQREASKEDPHGFEKLEELTRGLLSVRKADIRSAGETLPDDDPDVVAGMDRLKKLRQDENVPDVGAR
jgi:hypothetical protein